MHHLSVITASIAYFCGTTIIIVASPIGEDYYFTDSGTILEIGAVSVSVITDELLVIEVDIENRDEDLLIRTWILPDRFAFQFEREEIQQHGMELIKQDDE